MSDQDIFDNDADNTNKDDLIGTTEQADDKDPAAELLSGITNDDGTPKYKSVEDALNASKHAQDHISKLESELAELRNKGNPTEKLDELLDIVKSKGRGQGEDENDASTMKPEDVLGIVKDYLTDTKAAETRESNINTVTNHYKSRYGKDASEKLYGAAADLGFSKGEINRMIAQNPNAVLKMLGEEKQKKSADPVGGTGSVDTAQFQGKPTAPPKSIMGVSSSKDLTDAWKASQRRTLERLGYNPDEMM